MAVETQNVESTFTFQKKFKLLKAKVLSHTRGEADVFNLHRPYRGEADHEGAHLGARDVPL